MQQETLPPDPLGDGLRHVVNRDEAFTPDLSEDTRHIRGRLQQPVDELGLIGPVDQDPFPHVTRQHPLGDVETGIPAQIAERYPQARGSRLLR